VRRSHVLLELVKEMGKEELCWSEKERANDLAVGNKVQAFKQLDC